jgi:hypothetical protein
VVTEVEDSVVVGDQEVRWSPESFEKGPAHQFPEQKRTQCLTVEEFLGTSGADGAGALKFQWSAVAIGHQQSGNVGPILGFQGGQETDAEGPGVDNRVVHGRKSAVWECGEETDLHIVIVGDWKRSLERFGGVGGSLQSSGGHSDGLLS